MGDTKLSKLSNKSEEVKWGNLPKGMFGWFLWTFPTKFWRIIIWFLCVFIATTAIVATYQLYQIRNLDIKKAIIEDKIKIWKRSENPDWKSSLLKVWDKPGEVPDEIWEMAFEEYDSEVLLAMANNPSLPKKYKLELENTPYVQVRIAAYLNRQDKAIALNKMASDDNLAIRSVLMSSPNTPEDILRKLAGNINPQTEIYLANNPNTPEDVIRKLAKNEKPQIVSAVANNRNTPFDMLEKLAKDIGWDLDYLLASNLNTPIETLRKLANRDIQEIQSRVAVNSKTPEDVLRKLAGSIYLETRTYVANNPNTPEDILRELAKNEKFVIELAVTGNFHTPVDVLEELAKRKRERMQASEKMEIMMQIAEHPNVPIDLLEKWVEEWLNSNPEWASFDVTPKYFISQSPNAPEDVLRELAKDGNPFAIKGLASNPKTPEDILKVLARTEGSDIQRAVAKNQNTPFETLKILAVNKDSEVRYTALFQIISRPESEWYR